MNPQRMRRQFRKELLQLQAEQHRQGLARELEPLMQLGKTLSGSSTTEGATSLGERIQTLLALLLPDRWRKLLVYALALRKMARAFATRHD